MGYTGGWTIIIMNRLTPNMLIRVIQKNVFVNKLTVFQSNWFCPNIEVRCVWRYLLVLSSYWCG